MSTGVNSSAPRHACGNWEGESLIALRQMHTIGRMVVIDTTQGIARYLLL